MESKEVSSGTPSYNDLYFRVAISLLAAHFVIAFGIDKTIWQLLLMTAYYRALIASFVIAFLLVSSIYLATVKLDRRWPWGKDNIVRIAYQSFFGVVLPSAMAFILAAIYFFVYGINILKTVYLKYDYPIIVIFIIIINIYYFAYYQYLLNKAVRNSTPTENGKNYKAQFMVSEGLEKIPISIPSISSFYRDGNYNWLKTFDGKAYLHDLTLDETEQHLDPNQFFRANRQVIVNHAACRSYQLMEYGKLELILEPSLPSPIVISQKRAADFKRWIDR